VGDVANACEMLNFLQAAHGQWRSTGSAWPINPVNWDRVT